MIKIQDIAYARFRAPDLDVMERFVTDFGLVVAAREDEVLYARGTDPSPYLHVTERGAPGFLGLAFDASSREDLVALASEDGAGPIERLGGPGGGERVRLLDPNGYEIDVVWGREAAPELGGTGTHPLNVGHERRRLGAPQRVSSGPSSVKRIGHAGLFVRDFRQSAAWYQERLGFLATDEIFLGSEDNLIAAFMRCDRGAQHVDHHTVVCIQAPDGAQGLDHVSFEVEDLDALMVGHEHLGRAGYDHKMGVGRHILGSQIFDYWKDPWGHVVEHFTDGDLFDASRPKELHDPATALGTQWGTMAP